MALLSLNDRINARAEAAKANQSATNTQAAPSAPLAIAGPPVPARKGAILGAPNATLPDGTRLGPSGRALKGQNTPTVLASEPKPVQAVQSVRSFTPEVDADDDDETDHDDEGAGSRMSFDDIQGERTLTASQARIACEALDIAAEVIGRLGDNDHDGDEFGLVAAVLEEKRARFAKLLGALSVNPTPPTVPSNLPKAAPVDPFSRLRRVEPVAQTDGGRRGVCSWLRRK